MVAAELFFGFCEGPIRDRQPSILAAHGDRVGTPIQLCARDVMAAFFEALNEGSIFLHDLFPLRLGNCFPPAFIEAAPQKKLHDGHSMGTSVFAPAISDDWANGAMISLTSAYPNRPLGPFAFELTSAHASSAGWADACPRECPRYFTFQMAHCYVGRLAPARPVTADT